MTNVDELLSKYDKTAEVRGSMEPYVAVQYREFLHEVIAELRKENKRQSETLTLEHGQRIAAEVAYEYLVNHPEELAAPDPAAPSAPTTGLTASEMQQLNTLRIEVNKGLPDIAYHTSEWVSDVRFMLTIVARLTSLLATAQRENERLTTEWTAAAHERDLLIDANDDGEYLLKQRDEIIAKLRDTATTVTGDSDVSSCFEVVGQGKPSDVRETDIEVEPTPSGTAKALPRLTKAQREALEVAESQSHHPGGSVMWSNRTSAYNGWVHAATAKALAKRGLLKQSEKYEFDFTITDLGRAALANTGEGGLR